MISGYCYRDVSVTLIRFICTFTSLMLITVGTVACTEKVPKPKPQQRPAPEISVAYLVKNRIIADAPQFKAKIVATLPFEVITFDATFLLNLTAQIPDTNTSDTPPDYYIRFERQGKDTWRNYRWVLSPQLKKPILQESFSSIRQGVFYEDYTIDLEYEQLQALVGQDLQLTFVNQQQQSAYLLLPSKYIEAFIKIIDEHPKATSSSNPVSSTAVRSK